MVDAIILAGGKNSRIGKNKAFLEINGKPIIEIIIGKLRELFSNIIVVTNDNAGYGDYDVRLVEDIIKDRGPLAGIYSGLEVSGGPHCFVVGCDMPLINIDLIRYMTEDAGDIDVVVPVIKDMVEPLHGVYSKKCLPFIKEELDKGNASIKSFFNSVKVRYISGTEVAGFDKDFSSFFSVNTAGDLEKARLMWMNHE